ncbi:uncharacterized protein L969DRAFT_410266 [Mixia osmundae IAM 14324]|uniref:uncharacterized protein n=1 Tax=Mixia osmundae (strain CBS 9802 / IAM 14324 / JCM 22182 / KY 12970) TaxID=764103 RepID=UPI0004A5490F|nr:uncharacterized protein L969DRAFT_410266 [Mixia osmundae IAM 14324]KEI40212.1 hypothetical protein L969DRAFT_410266 [Mixia osmundae IAM 14324]
MVCEKLDSLSKEAARLTIPLILNSVAMPGSLRSLCRSIWRSSHNQSWHRYHLYRARTARVSERADVVCRTTELTGLPTQAGQDTLTTTSDRRRSSSASVQVIEPPTVRSKPNESQTSTLVGSQNGSNAANGGIIKATTANRSAGGIDQSAVIQIAAESREGSSLHAEADTSMESVHTRVSSQATEATVHMEIDTQPLVTTETMAASQSEALSAELAPVQPSQLLSSMPGNAQRIFAADPALRNVSIASILPQSPVSAFISGNAKRASTTHGARASAFVAPMSVPRASQAEQRSERSGRTSSLSAVREQSSNSQIAASTFESAKSSTMPATAFYASSRASLQTGRRSVSVHSDGSVGTAIGPTTSTSRADAIRETMHRIKATRSSVAHQGASLSARPSYLVSSAPSTMTLYHESRTSLAPSTASAAPSTRTTLTSTMREPRLSDALSDQSISQTSISFETAPPTQTMNQSRPSSASSATSQPTRMQDSRPVTSMIPRLRQTSGSKTDAEIKAAKERRERQAEETRLADERSERERVEKERLELQRLDAERQKQQAAEKRQAKVAEEALQRAEEEARLKAEEEARQKEAAAEQAAREAEKRAKAKREAQERERERQAAAERKAEAERQAAKLRDEEERRLRLLELEKRKKERAEVNARLAERKEKEAAATAAAIARRKLEDEETRRQAVERAAEAEAKRKAAAARQVSLCPSTQGVLLSARMV